MTKGEQCEGGRGQRCVSCPKEPCRLCNALSPWHGYSPLAVDFSGVYSLQAGTSHRGGPSPVLSVLGGLPSQPSLEFATGFRHTLIDKFVFFEQLELLVSVNKDIHVCACWVEVRSYVCSWFVCV